MSVTVDHRRRDALARERADALARETSERRRQQTAALAQLDCLHGVPADQLARLAECSELRAFVPGSVVLTERTPASFLYLVLRGTVSLALHDRAGRQTLIGVLDRGDCFGEGQLFGDRFRGASARAETVCYLLQLSLTTLQVALAAAPELQAALHRIYRRRLIDATLGRVPLLSQIAPIDRMRVASILRTAHYPRGAAIIREGEVGDALYLLESGQVVVEHGGRAIAHLDEGDFFGEMSLLTREPHSADIRALTPVEVLTLPVADFEALLARQPALAAQLREVVERRRLANKAARADTAHQATLAAALGRGLLRGTHVLVRDEQLCKPGCRICEDACATRHGHSRIRIDGVRLAGLDIADACRQCRFGAECVEACPESALQWNDRGALLVTDSCTGCGECVPACPYDAIRLVETRSEDRSPLWSLWRRLAHRRAQAVIPLEPTRPTLRADKCDLCHGHSDLACVSACPTGALRLAPVEELFPL